MLRPHAWGYARVSHRNSRDSGLSIESQHRIIADYYEKLRVNDDYLAFGETFEELAVSAWSKHLRIRPAGKELVSAAKRGDHIIFPSMDRGFRSVLDFAQQLHSWECSGVTLHFADLGVNLSTAAGRAIAHVACAYAELESSMRSERTRMALAIKRARQGDDHTPTRTPQRRYAASSESLDVETSRDTSPDNHTLSSGRLWAYVRCSHIDSAISGLGVEAQRAAIDRYRNVLADKREFANVSFGGEFYDEAVSAYRKPLWKRPQGAELNRVLQPGDHLVVSRLDRGFRSIKDFATTWPELKERGITLHVLDLQLDLSTPTGGFWAGQMCLFAEWESSIKSTRNKAAAQAMRDRGIPSNGRLPYGTKWLRKAGKQILVPDWPARKAMRWMARMRFHYGWSLRKIADRLEEILSKRESRRYIPESGLYVRGRKKLQYRKWTYSNGVKFSLKMAADLWPELYGDEPLSRTAAKAIQGT